jgi:hypothetical protein
MAETFFGNWYVQVGPVIADFPQSFTISGSDNADGLYQPVAGQPMSVQVTGAAWLVEMQWFGGEAGSGWQKSDVRRTTEFVLEEGLKVSLGADDNTPPLQDFDYDDLTLICISMDPAVYPLPYPGNPFDFTIPEQG